MAPAGSLHIALTRFSYLFSCFPLHVSSIFISSDIFKADLMKFLKSEKHPQQPLGFDQANITPGRSPSFLYTASSRRGGQEATHPLKRSEKMDPKLIK